jgi:hypothetical protein
MNPHWKIGDFLKYEEKGKQIRIAHFLYWLINHSSRWTFCNKKKRLKL